jgi:hypothetical protein
MSYLRFLHGIKVEPLGEAERVESIIARVRSIEYGGTGQEGQCDGIALVVVPTADFCLFVVVVIFYGMLLFVEAIQKRRYVF